MTLDDDGQCFNRLLDIFLTVYLITYLSRPVLYFCSFFSLKNVDPYDHYAACCVFLKMLHHLRHFSSSQYILSTYIIWLLFN